MNKHIPRIIPVALAATLILAACGSEAEVGEPIGTVTEQTGSGTMRTPKPISVTSSGQSGASPASAEGESGSAVADDRMMMIAPYVYEYVVSPDLPALPTNDTGFVFDAAAVITAEQVAALAASLGVVGEPVMTDDGYGVSWRVGPDDGSAPSVYVYDDAQMYWNYNGPWSDTVVTGCASPGSEGVLVDPAVDVPAETIEPAPVEGEVTILPVDTVVPGERPDEICEEPQPPSGILTAEEAQQRATEVLLALGVDVSTLRWEPYADEWYASVTAHAAIGDRPDVISYSFGFGAEGVMQYAGGSLARPEPVGPYTLIDLDAAIARLNDSTYGFTGRGGIEPMTAVAEGPPVDMPESGETTIEPETMTVTLVDVQPDLWWVWDADGSVWLVPAYRFIDSDGGWHTVPAVTDDFLIPVEPPVEPQPVTTDPGVEPPVSIAILEPQSLIGMSADEAMKVAEGAGQVARVVQIDGEFLAVTEDFNETRLNLVVETGADGLQMVTNAVYDADLGTLIAAEPVETTPPVEEVQFAPDAFDDLVGLPLDEFTTAAEERGASVRVSTLDGEILAVTADYSPTRVNVATDTTSGVETVVGIDSIG